jgi:hypothetical protein
VIPFYFHFVVLTVALLFLFRSQPSKDHGVNPLVWKAVLFLVWLTALMFLKSLVRPDLVHLIHVLILSLVLTVVLLSTVAQGALF